MIRAGLSRQDITVFEPGMAMLGWEQSRHRANGVGAALYARALVVDRDGARAALVICELGVITCAVRQTVIDALRREPGLLLGAHNTALCATHTHSGPSGMSQFPMYNSTNRGFSAVVFDTVVEGILDAIREASSRLEPAVLRYGEAKIPVHEPVGFNRAMWAHRSNPDRLGSAPKDRATSIDRVSRTLRVERSDGTGLGLINWFGVHGTSLHGHLDQLHPDNKGIAATLVEQRAVEAGHDAGFVAAFAQGALGDVTPNHRWDRRRREDIGVHDDDLASAADNGDIQARYAWLGFERAGDAPPLRGRVGGITRHLDMSNAAVSGRYTHDGRDGRTRVGRLGLGMSVGTREGPGPLRPFRHLIGFVSQAMHRLGALDPQVPLFEVGRGMAGKALGVVPFRRVSFLGKVDYTVAFLSTADDSGVLGDEPWGPSILPLQVLCLAGLPVVHVPGEPSTVSGIRLRGVLATAFTDAPATIVCGHANGYSGYITTRQEYSHQLYEGGSTLFGPNTLGAYLTAAGEMAAVLGTSAPAGSDPHLDPHSPAEGPALAPLDRERLVQRRRKVRARLPARLR